VINGMSTGAVEIDGETVPFDMAFLFGQICLPMVNIIIVMVLGRFLWRICFFGSGIRMETDLRHRMFDKAKDLSQNYYQTSKIGHLMSLFTNDIETVQDCFGSGILMFFDAALLGGLALLKMFRMDAKLSLLTLIPMALLFTVSALVRKVMMQKWGARQQAFSDLSDFSQESFSGIAVIKAFVKETKEVLAFKRLNRKNENANVAFTKISSLLHILITLFVESVICVILGYGGYLVYLGSFNAGELLEYIGYFSSIIWPIMAVSQLIDMSARGKASLSRISELLDAEVDVKSHEGAVSGAPLTGKIEFRGLTFRHPGAEHNALHDVSFVIKSGERVGIIGKTGAGKTTVAELLLRIYNIPAGMLYLDDRDINDIPIYDVRRQISYVPQDNFLFSAPIRDNIAFADDEAEAARVEEAAALSDIHDTIVSFPDGYQTVLGERGVTVSGGQKQRISIARALLKDAPILILDDAVSAVDTTTEQVILENLQRTRQGKTTLMIAHRISTVEHLDKIIFIDDGKLVAVGTHSELYDTCMGYHNMVDLQKLEDEKEVDGHA
ncbi:MAG: ABC transporter ATP-binding protein, partial [Clostridia bacterium]|nr:ABC transporter ATP-binding protein [Clostridia bacterium]